MRQFLSVLILLMLAMPIHSIPQNSSTGKLEGKITTISGKGLSDVNIQIQGTQLGTSTKKDGSFSLSGLPVGNQTVQISRVGYQKKQKSITIEAGSTSQLNVSLKQTAMNLNQVVLSGSPIPTAPIESTSDVNLITGAQKFRSENAGMGATVEATPGVRSVNTGTQTSKPVIRGLKGKRIRLLHNNIGTDYQQFGVRHMPNMDPYLADRLEVV
jgi:hypothetical protein